MNQFVLSAIRTRRSCAVLASTAAIFVLCQSPLVHGQSVDYGALEQLFQEPVTTSVNGSPQRASDVPATIEIITAEDIRRSGAKDIPGVLRHVSGVDTLEWGNDNVDLSIRGYDQALSPRVLVLLDGRQVYTDDYDYTAWQALPVELIMIRQIEVVKGPNSALFGFNAAGGVINIITYNPLYDNVNAISLIGGTQWLGAGSAVATHKFGNRVALRISGGGYTDNDFSTPIPPPVEITPRDHEYRGEINVDSIISINEKMHFGIEATHSVEKLNEMEPSYQIANSHHMTDSVKAQFNAESRLGLLQATVYTNWSNVTNAPGIGDHPFHFKSRVTVSEAHDIFQLGTHHTLRAAAEYRFTTETTTFFSGGNVNDHVVSASGMWGWIVNPAVSLTNAIRLDHLRFSRNGTIPLGYPLSNTDWNRSINELSYNSGVVWKPREVDSLRLTASRGVGLPSLVDSGGLLIVSPTINITGSPFLKPTIVTNYEIGWDHVMDGSHLQLRGSVFHQHSRDIRAVTGGFVPAPGGPYLVPTNIGDSDANGLELGISSALLKNYRWSVAYCPEWIADHFAPFAQNGAVYVDYQHTRPVQLVKANLGWTNKRWELDGYLHYQSNSFGIQEGTPNILIPIPSFVSLDGRVAYNLTNRVTWSVSGQNLAHATQVQTSGPAVERRVLGEMSFHF